MIVKNEEPVIERALRSALPFVTTWVIVDTGSTDRTKEIVQRVMGNLPGLLVDRPWVDFGHNRSEALTLCSGRMDWAIMMDADDTLEGTVPPAASWNRTDVDGYVMSLHHDQMRHERVQVFRVAVDWCYTGVIHEQATVRGRDAVVARLPAETYMITRCEGVRSRDPLKYVKDAAVLLCEWAREKSPRTLFFLAQSYRDAGMREEAAARYREYLTMPGATQQEKYLSIMSLIDLVTDPEELTRLAWNGIELVPSRLEVPYLYLVRWRSEERPMGYQQFAIATVLKGRKPADTDVFVNPGIYAWGLDNEIMGVAGSVGRWDVVKDAAVRCVVHMPTADMRAAATQRIRLADGKLG